MQLVSGQRWMFSRCTSTAWLVDTSPYVVFFMSVLVRVHGDLSTLYWLYLLLFLLCSLVAHYCKNTSRNRNSFLSKWWMAFLWAPYVLSLVDIGNTLSAFKALKEHRGCGCLWLKATYVCSIHLQYMCVAPFCHVVECLFFGGFFCA